MNLNQLNGAVSGVVDQARKYAAVGVAQALAMPQVQIAAGDTHGLAVGTGSYAGYGAIGVGYAQEITPHSQVYFGASAASSGHTAVKASVSVSW